MMTKTQIAEQYFNRIRNRYPNLDSEIKDILAEHTTPATSISLGGFVLKYENVTGKKFPLRMCMMRATQYLMTIQNICVYSKSTGNRFIFKRM
ncbi:maternal effect protein oskar-like [Ceratitis capitata]|uniref:maternal effect protein oskar-like n=1 Tax=Ceratitis capitata TaxID=7213 RepID=UPI00061889EB|nr:maternal effect protein oskar-like [Ceratitis capitata]